MTTPAPRPWTWAWENSFLYLLDANNRKIGTLWGTAKEREATAELIVQAVNGGAP